MCVGGCVDVDPECYDARTVVLTSNDAEQGEVTFYAAHGKSTYALAFPNGAGALPQDSCSATLTESSVYEDKDHDLSLTDDLGTRVEFRCHMDQPLFQDFRAAAWFGDVRLLDPTQPTLGRSATCQSCPYLGEGCAHYSEPLVSVEVLEATGAPAAYPDLVTTDFLRTIRVELQMGRVGDGTDGVCKENVELTASATFTLTQDRYQAQGVTEMCAL
jgi:hypothetical protein